ncbi:MAG: hypothetical protein GTO03_03630, partial [Planctomycetales bacterium]|nr:hypothetical protein [Planctomycetales bacterium]
LAGPVGRFFTGRLQRQALRRQAPEGQDTPAHGVPAPHFASQPRHAPSATFSQPPDPPRSSPGG